MSSTKSVLPFSKRGEIALTLTLISLGIMLIGTAFGGLRQQQTTSSKAADTSCTFKARVMVTQNNGKAFPYKSHGSASFWGVSNNKAQSNEFFHKDQYDEMASQYYFEKSPMKFKPEDPKSDYKKGELAEVFLIGLDRSKWRIKDFYCYNQENGKGCRPDTSLSVTAGTISIKNIEVDCGTDIIYGWEVEPIPAQTTPTPVPISPPACKYTAQVQVIKEDSNGKQTILTLSENRKNNTNNAPFGVRNDKLVQGLFGIHHQNGQDITVGDRAEHSYINNNEPFRDNFPSNSKLYYKNESATVTLTGLNPQFRIKRAFCDELDPRYGGCPKNIPDVKTTQTPETIVGFKPNCGVDINYGWVIYDPTETSPTPTIGAVRFPTGFTPTGGSITAIPYPTKAPSCVNNKGTIHGLVRTIIGSGQQRSTSTPNRIISLVTIKACGISIDKEDTADCSVEYGKQDIRGGETEYNIPNVPQNIDVAVVYQVSSDNTYKTAVKMSNCADANKRLGKPSASGQACIVRLTAPVCSAGPDFDINTVVPTPSYIPPTPIQQTVGHISMKPVADAEVFSKQGYSNKNYGSSINLPLIYDGHTSSNPEVSKIFLRFDVSKYKGVTVKHATIDLGILADTEFNNQSCIGLGTDTLAITQADTSWDENTITWENMPKPKRLQLVEQYPITCPSQGARWHYDSDVLLRNLQEWIDHPTSNNGFYIEFAYKYGNTRQIEFHSKEANFNDPLLTFDYEGTPTNPQPANKPSTPKTLTKSPLERRDLNGDKTINVVDFVLTLKKLGTKGTNVPEDFNNDGIVNAVDIASVVANFGKSTK